MNIAQTNLKAGRALEAAQTKFKGVTKLSAEAFERAVDEVAAAATRLIGSLVTSSEPRDREVEAMKARARFDARRPTGALQE